MSGAGRLSGALKSNENLGLQVAAGGCDWRETILVLLMVLAPVPLTTLLFAAWVFSSIGLQIVRGAPVEVPAIASIQLYGLSLYSIISWIDVAAVWHWSSRRRLSRDVFVFRRLTWAAVTASLVGFAIAMYGAPVMTHWLSQITGGRGPQVRLNDVPSVTVYVLCFVVTAPVCEEILYRGLLVAWLRRVGWRDAVIWLVGSVIFGANHLIPFGLAWSSVMVVFGAMLFAIRLWLGSLIPGWLVHFLFNAQFLIYPLLTWLAPALLP